MKVTVAGSVKEYAEGTTVEQLIVTENVEMPQYVTITINDDFVETADRPNRQLKEGDVVEVLYFMGGGC